MFQSAWSMWDVYWQVLELRLAQLSSSLYVLYIACILKGATSDLLCIILEVHLKVVITGRCAPAWTVLIGACAEILTAVSCYARGGEML